MGSTPNRKPRKPKPLKERKLVVWFNLRAKEIGMLFNVCNRTAHRYLAKARKNAGKKKGQFVTTKDFSSAMGLHHGTLLNALKRLFKPKHRSQ